MPSHAKSHNQAGHAGEDGSFANPSGVLIFPDCLHCNGDGGFCGQAENFVRAETADFRLFYQPRSVAVSRRFQIYALSCGLNMRNKRIRKLMHCDQFSRTCRFAMIQGPLSENPCRSVPEKCLFLSAGILSHEVFRSTQPMFTSVIIFSQTNRLNISCINYLFFVLNFCFHCIFI